MVLKQITFSSFQFYMKSVEFWVVSRRIHRQEVKRDRTESWATNGRRYFPLGTSLREIALKL